ncbi:Trypsin- protease [Metarhizium guizhouense ARSEF 977]|uniref:Trypsin-protease n=1 Tax=Metarhizium guizhouense (strain ARSEF 977) TaxID=1276136 RepID=A0A0B4H5Q6_METGA|nr:Trypsin- protease [Metarhizium guizhouense ARSEF 977]
MKSTPLLLACMASLALAGAIGDRQNAPNAVQADGQPPKSAAERVKEHCGRVGNEKDKKACNFAARQCTGRVARDAKIDEFLGCVDEAQACSSFALSDPNDQCVANAKRCKKEQNLPLGELTKLAECAKVGIPSYDEN